MHKILKILQKYSKRYLKICRYYYRGATLIPLISSSREAQTTRMNITALLLINCALNMQLCEFRADNRYRNCLIDLTHPSMPPKYFIAL